MTCLVVNVILGIKWMSFHLLGESGPEKRRSRRVTGIYVFGRESQVSRGGVSEDPL